MGMVLLPAASFHPHPHHHHHHHQHETLMTSADHPIIPLLTASPCLIDEDNSAAARAKSSAAAAGIQLWQSAQPQPHHHLHHHYPPPAHNPNPSPYLKKPAPMLDSSGILMAVGASGGGGAMIGGATTCQDCGNQAKKDCSHRRCRSCCKSRGFDCLTHVKSTWVPAVRRRERQQQPPGAAGSSASTSASKKPRLVTTQAAAAAVAATTTTTSHTSTSNTTRSFDTSSSHHQDAGFRNNLPGHVQAPAVFKCVRVTSIDDGEDEYAYHAMVKIGGHVFKGFLYDQGLEDSNSNNAAGASTIPNISELHLGVRNGSAGGASSSSPMLPPSDVFGGAPGGSSGMIGGPNFGKEKRAQHCF